MSQYEEPKLRGRSHDVPGFRGMDHSIRDLRKHPLEPDTSSTYVGTDGAPDNTPDGLLDETSPPWANGWVTEAGGQVPAGFYLSEDGEVRFHGRADGQDAGLELGKVMLYLPSGFRPERTELFTMAGVEAGHGTVQVEPDGAVTVVRHEPGPWHKIGATGEPPFVNGYNAAPSAAIPIPCPMQFRTTWGSLNQVSGGTIVKYREHQLEIQGDIGGVVPGDVVFVLPPAYRKDRDLPVDSHDDQNNYIGCRLLSSGAFIYGTP